MVALDMPDWNEMPDDFRVEFSREGARYVCNGDGGEPCCGGDCFVGDCAIAMFKLFAKRMADFWPEWQRQKREKLASGDLFEAAS